MMSEHTFVGLLIAVIVAAIGNAIGTVWAMKHLAAKSKSVDLQSGIDNLREKIARLEEMVSSTYDKMRAEMYKEFEVRITQLQKEVHDGFNGQSHQMHEEFMNRQREMHADLETHRVSCQNGVVTKLLDKLQDRTPVAA